MNYKITKTSKSSKNDKNVNIIIYFKIKRIIIKIIKYIIFFKL